MIHLNVLISIHMKYHSEGEKLMSRYYCYFKRFILVLVCI